MSTISRRQFLKTATAAIAAAPGLTASAVAAAQPVKRPRVAALYTVFRFRSHAHNNLENFLTPYLFNGKRLESPCEIVSFYADQRAPTGDTTEEVAKRFKIPVYKTIAEALTLGGKQPAVDAVLSIGEHGDYPTNKLGQVEYPRKRFFDEITAVTQKAARPVPIFNDKHLSYRWDWARAMFDFCEKHKIPFMAGSSVPLATRRPELEIPPGSAFEEAVSIHGGGFESYDFHGLEVLQSLVEFRKGGETGVATVEFLAGDALLQAGKKGRWSLPLAEAALAAEFGKKLGDWQKALPGEKPAEPHGLLITYRDGFRATVLKLGQSSVRWNFAAKLAKDDRLYATRFHVGPWGNRCLFMALSHAIQDHFVNHRAPYSVERTLLTTGMVEAAVRSRADRAVVKTPHLDIAYKPRDFGAFHERGASWKILEGQAEPKGLGCLADK
jgi:hypothetical protein